MPSAKPAQDHFAEYMARFPQGTRVLLEKIRQTIKGVAPQAVETISYGIPTFDLGGKHLVHFAAFKNHLSFFPTSSPLPVFKKELSGYKISKGTIQFPLGQGDPLRPDQEDHGLQGGGDKRKLPKGREQR